MKLWWSYYEKENTKGDSYIICTGIGRYCMKWWINRWKIESSSESDKYYTVAENDEGEFGCDCPIWKYQRRECDHIMMVREGLEDGTLERRYTLEEYLATKGLTLEEFIDKKLVDAI